MDTPDAAPPLTVAEARILDARLDAGFETVLQTLATLRDRAGWKALGYQSWPEYCQKRVQQSVRHVNRLIAAEEVRANLAGTHGSPATIPERACRVIAAAPPDVQRATMAAAIKNAAKTPTARELADSLQAVQAALPVNRVQEILREVSEKQARAEARRLQRQADREDLDKAASLAASALRNLETAASKMRRAYKKVRRWDAIERRCRRWATKFLQELDRARAL